MAIVLAATMASACAKKQPGAGACGDWLDRTLKAAEKVSMLKRRDRILGALGTTSCRAIPDPLRNAAVRSKAKNDERGLMLAESAQAVLGPSCRVPKDAATAWEIATTCPISKPDFKIADPALKDMTSTDYLVLNAIQKSLIQAGEYNQTAELLLRNFSLSAALLGEQAREKAR